jgi:uncharacterized membrane protein
MHNRSDDIKKERYAKGNVNRRGTVKITVPFSLE